MKGNLIHILNNTLEKKDNEDVDAMLIGPSLHELLPALDLNDWQIAENTIPLQKNSDKKEKKTADHTIWLGIFNYNIESKSKKSEPIS